MNTLGTHIKKLRTSAGMNATNLSIKLGIGSSIISKWENHGHSPSLDNLTKIAEIFKVSYQDLLDMKINDEEYDLEAAKNKNMDQDKKNDILEHEITPPKNDGEPTPMSVIWELTKNTTGLIAVNQTSADASKINAESGDKYATAHLKQTLILENVINSNKDLEARIKREQTYRVMERLALKGVPELWKSADIGIEIMGKYLSIDVPVSLI